jgi:hypothetical protein
MGGFPSVCLSIAYRRVARDLRRERTGAHWLARSLGVIRRRPDARGPDRNGAACARGGKPDRSEGEADTLHRAPAFLRAARMRARPRPWLAVGSSAGSSGPRTGRRRRPRSRRGSPTLGNLQATLMSLTVWHQAPSHSYSQARMPRLPPEIRKATSKTTLGAIMRKAALSAYVRFLSSPVASRSNSWPCPRTSGR